MEGLSCAYLALKNLSDLLAPYALPLATSIRLSLSSFQESETKARGQRVIWSFPYIFIRFLILFFVI
jgi:hypothetical protein